jgi:cytochrome P450
MGWEMVVLNSSKAAIDLLDKRSSTYSERAVLTLAGEIIGWNRGLGLMQYGPQFREFRKYMSKSIGTRASVEKFVPLLERETAKFVAEVMADPGSLVQHIRK